MKKKVTRDDVLKSIIKLINEYREDCVEEDAYLGKLHIGPSMLVWLFDWLKEEYRMVEMTMPEECELTHLLQRDTIGTLADIAMKHIPGDGEYDVEESKCDKTGGTRKVVAFIKSNKDIESYHDPELLTKEEFLKKCEDFFEARGTNIEDFEFMSIQINNETKERR